MLLRELGSTDVFSIVLLGNMNPALHHPKWYEAVDLISAEESETSLAGPDLICSAQVAQFSFDTISIICTGDRWEIRSTQESSMERMRASAIRIFDELLKHTPLRTLGFNFNRHYETSSSNVRLKLCEMINNISFPSGGTEATIIWKRLQELEECTHHVSGSNRSPQHILVASNYTYQFRVSTTFFLIGEVINSRLKVDMEDSNRFGEVMLKSFRT